MDLASVQLLLFLRPPPPLPLPPSSSYFLPALPSHPPRQLSARAVDVAPHLLAHRRPQAVGRPQDGLKRRDGARRAAAVGGAR